MASPQLQLPVRAPVVGSEKKRFSLAVQRLDSSHGPEEEWTQKERDAIPSEFIRDKTWAPGFRNRFPWLGFAALWAVLFASVGSIIVLRFSDDVSSKVWPQRFSPNVILAGLNNVANIAITVAVGEGIAIAWWRMALQGATVKELHHSWSFASNWSIIIFRWKYFNAIALAALTTKFAVIDGMLYQKATTTYVSVGDPTTVNMSAPVFNQFPQTGVLGLDAISTEFLNYDFNADVAAWVGSSSGIIYPNMTFLEIGIGPCEGGCNTTMAAPGFGLECEVVSTDVDYGTLPTAGVHSTYTTRSSNSTGSSKTTNSQNKTSTSSENYQTSIPIFSVNFTQRWPDKLKNYSRIDMDILYYIPVGPPIRNGSCPSTRTLQHCSLRPALLNYSVVVENFPAISTFSPSHQKSNKKNVTTVATEIAQEAQYALVASSVIQNVNENDEEWVYSSPEVIRYLEVNETQKAGGLTSLGGFQQAFQLALGDQVSIKYQSEHGWNIERQNVLSTFVDYSEPRAGGCDYEFDDPTWYIMNQISTLTFIAMLDTAGLQPLNPTDNPTTNQTLISTQVQEEIFYESIYPYLYGALASTVVCILCILPAYWGFWELGREVSLGPFEIANALQAPAFQPVPGGAGHVREVLKAVGRQKLQYGEMIDDGHGGKKLTFKEPDKYV